jgi:guanylate kinase
MLVLLIGASGCGKTTVANKLPYPKLVSTTTREMRPGEVNGKDYHFVTEETFENMLQNGKLVSHTIHCNNAYGFQKEHLDPCNNSKDIYLSVVDHHGVISMREYLGKENVCAIYIEAKAVDLVKYMRQRGDTSEQIIDRLVHSIDSQEWYYDTVAADYITESTSIDKLVDDVKSFVELKIWMNEHGHQET